MAHDHRWRIKEPFEGDWDKPQSFCLLKLAFGSRSMFWLDFNGPWIDNCLCSSGNNLCMIISTFVKLIGSCLCSIPLLTSSLFSIPPLPAHFIIHTPSLFLLSAMQQSYIFCCSDVLGTTLRPSWIKARHRLLVEKSCLCPQPRSLCQIHQANHYPSNLLWWQKRSWQEMVYFQHFTTFGMSHVQTPWGRKSSTVDLRKKRWLRRGQMMTKEEVVVERRRKKEN